MQQCQEKQTIYYSHSFFSDLYAIFLYYSTKQNMFWGELLAFKHKVVAIFISDRARKPPAGFTSTAFALSNLSIVTKYRN